MEEPEFETPPQHEETDPDVDLERLEREITRTPEFSDDAAKRLGIEYTDATRRQALKLAEEFPNAKKMHAGFAEHLAGVIQRAREGELAELAAFMSTRVEGYATHNPDDENYDKSVKFKKLRDALQRVADGS